MQILDSPGPTVIPRNATLKLEYTNDSPPLIPETIRLAPQQEEESSFTAASKQTRSASGRGDWEAGGRQRRLQFEQKPRARQFASTPSSVLSSHPVPCTLLFMEPWLRGTHTGLPSVLRAVVHALELSREDIEHWCQPLSDEALNARPAANPDALAPVAFHLRHIVRTLDRLLTYAEGHQLSPAQLAALNTELDSGATNTGLFSEFRKGIDDATRRIQAFANADLEQPRAVGRKALPTSVGGLLVHCADHTQRHTGQAITTAKIVQKWELPVPAE
jgi:uncharacterized damage-inducible protein DinB